MQTKSEVIQDIIGQVVELTWCHSLWWAIVNKADRTHNQDVIVAYHNFFAASVFAFQQSFFVSANRLFDEDSRASSLRKLVTDLDSKNQALADKLKGRLQAEAAPLKKILLLRHNVYGHRSSSISPTDLFNKVGIKPNEMKAVLGLAQEITIALAVEAGVSTEDALVDKFKLCAENVCDETRRIIEALK